MHLRPTQTTAVAAVLALLAAACGGEAADDAAIGASSDDEGGADVQVVATTSILGDIVQQLVGDDGEVTVLMGPGVDPHGYEPSARDAATMREADLVVANGLQLEEALLATLESAEEDGVRVLELAEQLDPIAFNEDGFEHDDEGDDHGHDDDGDDHGHDDDGDDHGHDDDGDDHGHDHGPEDPHVWFDPVRMVDGVELLAAELAEVAPEVDGDEWDARAAAYNEELLAVHAELEEAFAQVPDDQRRIVTNHDALGYLAARYDLEVVGTVIPGASTQAETDPRQFSELVATVEETGVTTVFAENTDSTRLAEQLASEVVGRGDVEVEVVQVATDALGEPGSEEETYLGLLRATGTTIADALS
jgi:zinc/manganese transport system substrate-binding protein